MSLYFQPADKDVLYLDRFGPDELLKAYEAYKEFFNLSTDLAQLSASVRERPTGRRGTRRPSSLGPDRVDGQLDC